MSCIMYAFLTHVFYLQLECKMFAASIEACIVDLSILKARSVTVSAVVSGHPRCSRCWVMSVRQTWDLACAWLWLSVQRPSLKSNQEPLICSWRRSWQSRLTAHSPARLSIPTWKDPAFPVLGSKGSHLVFQAAPLSRVSISPQHRPCAAF